MTSYGKKFYFIFEIVLTGSLVSVVSTSCTQLITCPCGSTRRAIYYTHCLNETLEEEISCERWANCRICEPNITHCLACLPERSGPTCEETKERKTCHDPGIPENGYRQNEDGNDDTDTYPLDFQVGESVYFSCNEDSVLEGRSVITCTSTGVWSDSLPRCKKHEKQIYGKFCKYPGVDVNGMIENLAFSDVLGDGKMFPSTTRLKFRCKEGYKLVGSRAIFCLCSGEWTSDPPSCVPEDPDNANSSPVHCGGRGPISNGRVIEYRDLDRQFPSYEEYGVLYPVGSRLHYSCNKGFSLLGTEIVICESTGLWSEEEPKCIEEQDLSETSTPKDDNPISSIVSNPKTFESKPGKNSSDRSNNLIFKFFFL